MIHTLERFLEWGGVKKAVTCLVFSGIALLVSIFDLLWRDKIFEKFGQDI